MTKKTTTESNGINKKAVLAGCAIAFLAIVALWLNLQSNDEVQTPPAGSGESSIAGLPGNEPAPVRPARQVERGAGGTQNAKDNPVVEAPPVQDAAQPKPPANAKKTTAGIID